MKNMNKQKSTGLGVLLKRMFPKKPIEREISTVIEK